MRLLIIKAPKEEGWSLK